jgi:hypothetical protein
MTRLKKTGLAAREMRGEIAALKKAVDRNKASTLRQLELEKKVQELDDLQHMVAAFQHTLDAIPEEIVAQYRTSEKGENAYSHQK